MLLMLATLLKRGNGIAARYTVRTCTVDSLCVCVYTERAKRRK